MGQPIKLIKGKKKMTVYGQAQLRVELADGWRVAESSPPPAKPKTAVRDKKS